MQHSAVCVRKAGWGLRRYRGPACGLAWLPESHVAPELAAGQLVRAGGVEWDLEVEITIFRPRDHLASAAESFWTIVQSQTPESERVLDPAMGLG